MAVWAVLAGLAAILYGERALLPSFSPEAEHSIPARLRVAAPAGKNDLCDMSPLLCPMFFCRLVRETSQRFTAAHVCIPPLTANH